MLPSPLKNGRARVALTALILLLACLHSDASGSLERTLAMIKPDGVRGRHQDSIRKIIRNEGFKIVAEKEHLFDEEGAKSFYNEHAERVFFPQLVQFMTSDPVLVMVLEKQNAIKDWRALMGPTDSNKARIQAPNSVRARYGLDGQSNCVHGSDSPEAATREIATFFDLKTPEDLGDLTTGLHDEL